ncbi:hypothetical protein [Arthrobacter sp. Br18]|uniref:hypothetical protein n=1 Tax=Arthrobacter sp. Br18 TaxID=1312954 RepID=UPI0004797171|nr:hypothetical protein [Arthrobacter sp. Br18]
MQNLLTKSLAATAISGVMILGGAGMASANSTETSVDEVTTQVSDNRITDSGNVSLDNILGGGVLDIDDIASGNNVLNGIDTNVSDNLNGNFSGNDADVDASPDVDADVDADNSVDSSTDSGEDNEGLLGGLL